MSERADSPTESLLRELADRESIRDLACLYAHHVWQQDVEGIAGLFTEDGEMDTPELPLISGREALREAYTKMFEEDEFHPFVHNHIIELDGDVATGTCYVDLRARVGGRHLISSGFYHDRYARVDGQWKFRHRKVNMCEFFPLRDRRREKPPES